MVRSRRAVAAALLLTVGFLAAAEMTPDIAYRSLVEIQLANSALMVSGTVIAVEDECAYVATVHHDVVELYLLSPEENRLDVRFYGDGGTYEGHTEEMWADTFADLAIVRVDWTTEGGPDQVRAVGYSADVPEYGAVLFAGTGQSGWRCGDGFFQRLSGATTIQFTVRDQQPDEVFGFSGGPVFDTGSGELICILNQMYGDARSGCGIRAALVGSLLDDVLGQSEITGVTAASEAHGEIVLSWHAPELPGERFIVERRVGAYGGYEQLEELEGRENSFVDDDTTPDEIYHYRIYRSRADGRTSYSAEAHARATSLPPLIGSATVALQGTLSSRTTETAFFAAASGSWELEFTKWHPLRVPVALDAAIGLGGVRDQAILLGFADICTGAALQLWEAGAPRIWAGGGLFAGLAVSEGLWIYNLTWSINCSIDLNLNDRRTLRLGLGYRNFVGLYQVLASSIALSRHERYGQSGE